MMRGFVKIVFTVFFQSPPFFWTFSARATAPASALTAMELEIGTQKAMRKAKKAKPSSPARRMMIAKPT